MKKVTLIEEAEELLLDIQEKIRHGFLFLRNKEKNAQTLARLGLTASHAKRIIEGLTVADYVSGPEADLTYPDKYVAVFGKQVDVEEVYIKVSVGPEGLPVVCLSFHEAAWPMTYQFK